jgi:hypothetical protein
MGDVYFPGQSVGVSFGLEYEGMSPRVWEHFGLGSEKFLARVDAMPTEQQTVMIDWLMTELINKRKLDTEMKANPKLPPLPEGTLPSNYDPGLNAEEKRQALAKFVAASHDSPMSYMPHEIRYKWINHFALKSWFLMVKKSAPDSSSVLRKDFMPRVFSEYSALKPLLGRETEQIGGVVREGRGWELLSTPSSGLGRFEEKLGWFEKNFGSLENQHKRVVFVCGTSCEKDTFTKFAMFNSMMQHLLFLIALEQRNAIMTGESLHFMVYIDELNNMAKNPNKFDLNSKLLLFSPKTLISACVTRPTSRGDRGESRRSGHAGP